MGGEKKKGKSKSGKKSVHRMNIRRAANGGFIVEHHMKPDPKDPMSGSDMEEHQVGDVDQLQQHVADHMGDQPEAEQEQPAAPPVAAAQGV
jgi:hypothetical protein